MPDISQKLLLASDIHSNRPAATLGNTGALFPCQTHLAWERSNGTTYDTLQTNAGPVAAADLPAPNIVTITDADSPYTVLGTEDVLKINPSAGDVTFVLPLAANRRALPLYVVMIDSVFGHLFMNTQGSDTVGTGATTSFDLAGLLAGPTLTLTLLPDGGTNWIVLAITAASFI